MRFWLAAGAVNGFVAVAMGAFAAHSPLDRLPEKALGWIATGADYQMTHALALLAVAWLASHAQRPAARRLVALAGAGFLLGCLLFSVALYVMALAGLGRLGLVVPLGGIGFLVGWLALFACGLWAFAGSRDSEGSANMPPWGPGEGKGPVDR